MFSYRNFKNTDKNAPFQTLLKAQNTVVEGLNKMFFTILFSLARTHAVWLEMLQQTFSKNLVSRKNS